MKSLKVVSLFSGAGGLDLGFKEAGFEIVWANDFDKDAVNTYKLNIGDHIVHKDIRTISSNEIPIADVVLGGFPCQGFSINNKNRSMKDERNFLYKELLRVVKDKQPKFFIGENVKGLLSINNGSVIHQIIEDFEKIGYYVNYQLFNMSNYNIPQNRERIILYGNKIGYTGGLYLNKHNKKISVEEAIGFLKNVDITNNPIKLGKKTIYNHIASTNVADTFYARKNPPIQAEICDYLKFYRKKAGLSTKKIDDIFGYKHTAGHWFRKDNNSGSIPTPQDWLKLKSILNFDDKYDKQVTELILKELTFEQSLRITNWDKPSDTITATTPEIHVNKMRRLSVRECAILQTFPNDFIFTGSLNSMYRQIGNAVPPEFAKQIALEVKRLLNIKTYKDKKIC